MVPQYNQDKYHLEQTNFKEEMQKYKYNTYQSKEELKDINKEVAVLEKKCEREPKLSLSRIQILIDVEQKLSATNLKLEISNKMIRSKEK